MHFVVYFYQGDGEQTGPRRLRSSRKTHRHARRVCRLCNNTLFQTHDIVKTINGCCIQGVIRWKFVCVVLLSSCRFEKEVYNEWLAGVDEACAFNLNQPLLSRDEETKLIKLNFDDQVSFVPCTCWCLCYIHSNFEYISSAKDAVSTSIVGSVIL